MNTLTLYSPTLDFSAIDRADLQPSTRIKYTRTWNRAIESGTDLFDPEQVAAYSFTLSASEKLFFSAAMKLQLAALEQKMKSGINPFSVTPEQIASIQAVIWKMDELRKATPTHKQEGTKAHTWLSPSQVEQITSLPDRSTARGMRDYIVLSVLLGAGLRREEMTNIQFSDLRQQPTKTGMRDVLSVLGKGNKRRVVPISATLAKHLKEWHRLAGDGYIARAINKAGTINGSLSAIGVHNIVRQYGALIDLPELDAHDCRRTYARIGYDAGVRVEQISRLLGHADVKTTMVYLGIDIDVESTVSDFIPLSGD